MKKKYYAILIVIDCCLSLSAWCGEMLWFGSGNTFKSICHTLRQSAFCWLWLLLSCHYMIYPLTLIACCASNRISEVKNDSSADCSRRQSACIQYSIYSIQSYIYTRGMWAWHDRMCVSMIQMRYANVLYWLLFSHIQMSSRDTISLLLASIAHEWIILVYGFR